MQYDLTEVITRLGLALLAGGIIGLERAYNGREAGFRTHTLVAVSSSLLMVLMVYQWALVPEEYLDTVRADPSRMAQGIMTGIGFLGAGVIIKEGLTVRGLTTAASIWMTAAIGIVIGLGLYIPAYIATLISIIILSAFRSIEGAIPSRKYARLYVRFERKSQMNTEASLRDIMARHHIKAFEPGYRLEDEGKYFEYEMTICSKNTDNFKTLAQHLLDLDDVYEFRIVPYS
jgi:putative Mg2+ transporter-C (MgtC) family protein